MLLSSLPITLATIVLSVSSDAFAVPSPATPAGQSIPLRRSPNTRRTVADWGQWARNHREMLQTKYGAGQARKRSSGTNLITNQNADSSFFGSLAIGTPPVSYNVILDTGSADLWVADSNCITGCESVPTFDSSASTTFKNESTAFSITYGSGQAAGILGEDTIQMAGFSVSNQVFAVCDTVSSGLLTSPVSGLLGLAWQTIASSGATPLWQTLVASGAWDEPVMTFQLTRYVDDSRAEALEPGGTFTMGFANTSLYTGDIEYTDIPTGETSYWILPMTSLTVQGSEVTLPSGSSSYSAIDTGTTLVGGPSDLIADLFAQIPDSQAGTGDYEGYWIYPCDTTVNVTIAFGGQNWPISAEDFQLTKLSSTQCLGAFFELTTGSSAPSWIVGDTFLKNVYSVFRYNPASVGFAALSTYAESMNDDNSGVVPSATIGSVSATISATSTGGDRVSSAATAGPLDSMYSTIISVGAVLVTTVIAGCAL